MLLNILQHTRHPPQKKNCPAQNISTAVEKLCVDQLPWELNSYQTSTNFSSIPPIQIGFTKTCIILVPCIWSIPHLYSSFHSCLPSTHLNYIRFFSGDATLLYAPPMSTLILSLKTPKRDLMSCYSLYVFSDLNMLYKHKKMVSIMPLCGEPQKSANFHSTKYKMHISTETVLIFFQQKLQSQESES